MKISNFIFIILLKCRLLFINFKNILIIGYNLWIVTFMILIYDLKI